MTDADLPPSTPPRRASGPVWVVVVAGGGGTRFGGAKQYAELLGRRVLDWSVGVAAEVADETAGGVVAVVPAGEVDEPIPGATAAVPGGATRAESVRAGLAAVPVDAGVILVHDAARPAASAALFRRVVDAVRAGAAGVVPAVAVTDSLRLRAGGAVDRDELVAVQTPQGFDAGALRDAHASGDEATDDATLVERAGATIVLVEGEETNIKLTHPQDRALLEAVLADRGAQVSTGGPS